MFLMFTFCLSLHNFAIVDPTTAILLLKESLCHGDSRNIQDHVIWARHNKMAAQESQKWWVVVVIACMLV